MLARLEYFNPAGPVRDRIAKAVIDVAGEKGLLKPSSGNTGERYLSTPLYAE